MKCEFCHIPLANEPTLQEYFYQKKREFVPTLPTLFDECQIEIEQKCICPKCFMAGRIQPEDIFIQTFGFAQSDVTYESIKEKVLTEVKDRIKSMGETQKLLKREIDIYKKYLIPKKEKKTKKVKGV